MAYKPPQPDVGAFSDHGQQNVVRRIYERLNLIEKATSLQSIVSGRAAPAPPQAVLSVTTNPKIAGHAFIRITNPQYLGTNKNRIATSIEHWLQASPTPSFNSGIIDFPKTSQTYIDTSELGSGVWYLQLRSTTDGKTFNNPVGSGKVVIP
jgi:hypothetical protein